MVDVMERKPVLVGLKKGRITHLSIDTSNKERLSFIEDGCDSVILMPENSDVPDFKSVYEIKFVDKTTPEGFVLELEKGRFVQYELIDLLTRSLNSSKVLKTNTNWVHVVRMLNVGSTVAHRICEKLGVDPESTKFEAKELSHD